MTEVVNQISIVLFVLMGVIASSCLLYKATSMAGKRIRRERRLKLLAEVRARRTRRSKCTKKEWSRLSKAVHRVAVGRNGRLCLKNMKEEEHDS